jgi:hypothetical protein
MVMFLLGSVTDKRRPDAGWEDPDQGSRNGGVDPSS